MFKSARKFTLAATLRALAVPIGKAFAQTTPTPPSSPTIIGTDPEPLIIGTDPEPLIIGTDPEPLG